MASLNDRVYDNGLTVLDTVASPLSFSCLVVTTYAKE